MPRKIAVLGAGSWGSILGSVLAQNGHDVWLWSNSDEQAFELNNYHMNKKYMGNYKYPESLRETTDLKKAVFKADAVLFVVPTKVIRPVAKQLSQVLKELDQKVLLLHASKGLELGSHKRISEVILEEIPKENHSGIVVLSGPSHAEEVAKKDITLITAASKDLKQAQIAQKMFMNDYFRIYTNTDVIGVETGAAFKNIIAIGAGALHGLGYGDDAKAALMTRGLAEISRLGVSFGADPLTFIGLSGVGDLIVTCTSVHSRNWRAGNQLGKGESLEEVTKNMGMVIEGINTCKAAYELAKQKKIDMPITEAIYHVLYKDADIKTEIEKLMQREGKMEA